MAAKTKIVPVLFLPYDYDKEENYINSMSDKGWQLKKAGAYHHTYIKSNEKYRYKLDFNNTVKYNSDKYNRYLSIFGDQGWEHVSSCFIGWHYFRKKINAELTDDDYTLYTDDTSLQEMLGRWSRLARILQIVFLILLVLGSVMAFSEKDLMFLPDAVLELLGIAIFEICILNLKSKRVFSKSIPSLGFFGGYLLFGIFFVWFAFTMILFARM